MITLVWYPCSVSQLSVRSHFCPPIVFKSFTLWLFLCILPASKYHYVLH